MDVFEHTIMEVGFSPEPLTIAKARNWAQAYSIAQVMSKAYPNAEYTCVNYVTGLRLTYQAGEQTRRQHCTCGQDSCETCAADRVTNERIRQHYLDADMDVPMAFANV